MTNSGRFSCRHMRISSANASSLRGSTQNCAGPPTRKRGVLRQRLVKAHVTFVADDLLQLLGDHEIGREQRQLFVNVARAEAQTRDRRARSRCRHRDAADSSRG